MKKVKLLLLLLFLHLGRVYAQVEIRGVTTIKTDEIKSDPFNTSPNKDFEKRISLNPIDESTNDLEIRFYKLEGLSNTRELKTVILKNGLWAGTLYDESKYPKVRIKKYKLEADKGFPALFQMLLDNNILELPSQEELAS
ncbi:hypothetical protein [Rufibacter quisquiliarum]|uniref:Uncharacterized protein n=1 Tax=Rufibacter quisquiliarum TaxID=1549639 RepID=A0A839H1Y9_9BACT|nr:hypothetical protein [Rufibacter quisquiliarum]MBA9079901.1 hypothetical protein [Rufibacter quisquiliarum]